MDQSKKIQIVAILALMIATMSLLVGFSSLNAQLEIGNAVNVKNNEWNVHFGKITNIGSSNEAYARFTSLPSVSEENELAVSFAALMSQPGNDISFNIEVINEGNIDAKVSDIDLSGISGYERYITWSITGITVGDVIAAEDIVDDVKITLSYNHVYDNVLLFEEINLDDINAEIKFVQNIN